MKLRYPTTANFLEEIVPKIWTKKDATTDAVDLKFKLNQERQAEFEFHGVRYVSWPEEAVTSYQGPFPCPSVQASLWQCCCHHLFFLNLIKVCLLIRKCSILRRPFAFQLLFLEFLSWNHNGQNPLKTCFAILSVLMFLVVDNCANKLVKIPFFCFIRPLNYYVFPPIHSPQSAKLISYEWKHALQKLC